MKDSSQIVLLTNDLTIDVAQEAIEKKASVIISYRKIFHSLFRSIIC